MPQVISKTAWTTNEEWEFIESTLEVKKLQENQTGYASQFLDSYILSYGMYMFVLNLLMLYKKGISR